MYTTTILEKDGVEYVAVAQFSEKTKKWLAYLLKDNEWYAYAGTTDTSTAAFRACQVKLYGVTQDMGKSLSTA